MRRLFNRSRKQSDFNAEIEAHLQHEVDRLVSEGLGWEAARTKARQAFGNATQAREQFYESKRGFMVGLFWSDIHFGWRMLIRNLPSTLVAILALALAIGLNTAIFSLVNAVLLRLLPVPDAKHMVMLTDPNSSMTLGGMVNGERPLLSYPEFVQLRKSVTKLSDLCASQLALQHWGIRIGGRAMEQVSGRLVSENYFSAFGVKPVAGRLLRESDARKEGQDPFVVLSYDYWQRRFHGDASVVGTPIVLNRTTFTIIGVAAKGFRGETVGQNPDIWLPALMQHETMPGFDGLHEDLSGSATKFMWLHVFGRLRTGVSMSSAQAQIDVLFHNVLAAGYPLSWTPQERKRALDQRIRLRPLGNGAFHGRKEFAREWTILAILAVIVLLVACANIANLLLARATTRIKEVTIRLSLGASALRVAVQFLVESLLLAALGGCAGVVVAVLALRFLLFILARSNSSLQLVAEVDPQVLGFIFAITLFTGVLFGLAPAWRALQIGKRSHLRETGRAVTSGRERTRFAYALVAVQIALSFLLVTGAGLFLRTLWNLQQVSLGYPSDHVLLVKPAIFNAGYDHNIGQLFRQLSLQLQTLPGVRSVSFSDRGLFSGFEGAFAVNVEGFQSTREADTGSTGDWVGPHYFSILGIPILSGREIDARDTVKSTPVCLINHAFAKNFFHNTNPLGRHITYDGRVMEIVGVTADARVNSLRGTIEPKFYAPASQMDNAQWLIVRTQDDPARLRSAITKKIAAFDANLPIEEMHTLAQLIEEQNAQPRLIADLCVLFSLVALILAAVGIWGVLSYNVARRINEIGIRMALGAGRRRVAGMIVRETAYLVTIGVVAGLAATAVLIRIASTQLLDSGLNGPRWSLQRYEHVDNAIQLYGVSPMDIGALLAASSLLVLIALVAAYLPARRATRVEPMEALRHQ
jgi:predicted permease